MIGQKAATISERLSVWKFTIDTEAKTSGAKRTAVPLHLYGQANIEYIVDWGDSSKSSLSPSDYLEDDASASVHEYTTAGKYQITIFCTDWSKARILAFNSTSDPADGDSTNCSLPRFLWQETLISIDTPLPAIKGKSITYISNADTVYDGPDNNLSILFCWCDSLKSIPAGLFDANPSAENFSNCFANCRSLAQIPKGLFDLHTNAARFDMCFYNCDSLVSIPQGLFDHNALATNFSACFMQCEALKDIPLRLFAHNTAATNFSSCFQYCLSLERVPYDLFLYNTAATNMQWCFRYCPKLKNFKIGIGSSLVSNVDWFVDDIADNARRIVCVPESSTTYNCFLVFCNGDNQVVATHVQAECLQSFEYTIDTEATTSGAKTGAIPLSASSNAARLFIDWGDNSGTELEAADVDATSLTHEYASAGEYSITVATADWSGYSILNDSAASSSNSLVQTFRNTLKTVDAGLPPVSNGDVDYLFYGCTHLTSVTSHILDHLDGISSAVGCFKNCSSLAVISAGTLRKQTELLNASEMFAGCSTIATTIPSGLLSQCRKLTTADRMFKDCTGIDYIPETLFLNNTALTSRTDAFSGTSATIPTFLTKESAESAGIYIELFDTEAVTDDDSRIGIPFNLTAQNVTITAEWGDGYYLPLTSENYSQTDSLSSLHQYSNPGLYFVTMESSDWSQTRPLAYISTNAIPQPVANSLLALYHRQRALIEVCTKLPMTFYQIYAYSPGYEESLSVYVNSTAGFYAGCCNLRQIPSNLLANAGNVTSTNGMFAKCYSLRTIPSGLFEGCSSITHFTSIFIECRGLLAIPSGLLDDCTSAQVLYAAFENCSSLKTIPSGLLAHNTAAARLGEMFCGCSSLTAIPSGLFDACTNAVEFASTFCDCSSLTAIPSGLFDSNIACQSFYGTFYNTAISVIPNGLFSHNSGAYEFDYCFGQCTSLTAIPSGLFDACTVAETFTYCFQKCTKVTSIPDGLFAYNAAATTFSYCFANCSGITSIPSAIFTNNAAVTNLSYCFYSCSKLGGFDIHIGSTLVSNAASFVTKKTGATRTVNVPAGSTTYTTFDGLASTLGLTVVGE